MSDATTGPADTTELVGPEGEGPSPDQPLPPPPDDARVPGDLPPAQGPLRFPPPPTGNPAPAPPPAAPGGTLGGGPGRRGVFRVVLPPPLRRHVRAARGGHRRRPEPGRVLPGALRLADLARAGLGRGSGRRRPVRPVHPE